MTPGELKESRPSEDREGAGAVETTWEAGEAAPLPLAGPSDRLPNTMGHSYLLSSLRMSHPLSPGLRKGPVRVAARRSVG